MYQVKLFSAIDETNLEKQVNDFLATNASKIKDIEEQVFYTSYQRTPSGDVSVEVFKCRIFYSTTVEGAVSD